MIRKTDVKFVENLRGGEGTIEMRHILSKDELMGHGTMYVHLVFPPHSSIGVHQHIGNTEPYYVLKGNGIFIDNEGVRHEITAGDVCTIEVGQSHGIENPTDEVLEVMGLVINEEAK